MKKLVLAMALVCAASMSVPAFAQTPQINSNAARIAIQPRLLTPDARAALASRLTGERITPAAVTGTVSVSILSPIVGDPRAPTASLEIRRGTWITTGDDPRAVIYYGTSLDLKFAIEANARYLVLCDVSRGFRMNSIFGQPAPAAALSWEGERSAAFLIPLSTRAGNYMISLTDGGELRSCEISRIG